LVVNSEKMPTIPAEQIITGLITNLIWFWPKDEVRPYPIESRPFPSFLKPFSLYSFSDSFAPLTVDFLIRLMRFNEHPFASLFALQ